MDGQEEKRCYKCNNVVRADEGSFCSSCGSLVFCPQEDCHAYVESPDDCFCAQCGKPLPHPAEQTAASEAQAASEPKAAEPQASPEPKASPKPQAASEPKAAEPQSAPKPKASPKPQAGSKQSASSSGQEAGDSSCSGRAVFVLLLIGIIGGLFLFNVSPDFQWWVCSIVEAPSVMEKVASSSSAHAGDASWKLSLYYEKKGEGEKRRQWLQKTVDSKCSHAPEAAWILAEYYRQNQAEERAIPLYEIVANHNGSNAPEALWQLGNIYQNSDKAKACSYFERLVQEENNYSSQALETLTKMAEKEADSGEDKSGSLGCASQSIENLFAKNITGIQNAVLSLAKSGHKRCQRLVLDKADENASWALDYVYDYLKDHRGDDECIKILCGLVPDDNRAVKALIDNGENSSAAKEALCKAAKDGNSDAVSFVCSMASKSTDDPCFGMMEYLAGSKGLTAAKNAVLDQAMTGSSNAYDMLVKLSQKPYFVKDFDKERMLELAIKYISGNDVTQNFGRALYLCKLCGDQGEAKAQLACAAFYELGYGTPKNHYNAVYWLRMAAQNNKPDVDREAKGKASMLLGMHLLCGRGCNRDKDEAGQMLRQAIELGVTINEETAAVLSKAMDGDKEAISVLAAVLDDIERYL